MRPPENFEEAMSILTAALGSLERLTLTSDQQTRYEQFCIRAMSLQQRMRKN